jgi:hypothetical protein
MSIGTVAFLYTLAMVGSNLRRHVKLHQGLRQVLPQSDTLDVSAAICTCSTFGFVGGALIR